jgi:serine/threonine protein kinase
MFMPVVLNGKSIDYEVLECVARGQESIVYKAQVKSTKRCVALKFRLKESIVKFRKKELPIFRALDHLNIIKIFDYVEDLGSLRLEDEIDGRNFIIDRANYFCVVEDFVTGEKLEGNTSSSLYNYCKQRAPKKEASYDEVIAFQEDYIFKWIFEFCDIMSHMTKENEILHLDIKPENIMVTRTGSIVLIDMGLSGFLEPQSAGLNLQYDFDHINISRENVERRYITIDGDKVLSYVYGTPGFAAPECYFRDGEGCEQNPKLKNPFVEGRATLTDGIVDIRSDIFSFGCTLWDIIHLGGYGLDDKHKDYASISSSESKPGYFRRDLHYASPYYLQELEDMILKCTEENPDKRFQDYSELKKAAESARRKLPKSEESYKRNKLLRGGLVLSVFITVLILLLYNRGLNLGYEIANEDFRIAASNYSENTNPVDFRDQALLLLSEAGKASVNVDGIYKEILSAVVNNDKITSTEFSEILYKCLNGGAKGVNDNNTILFINAAMKNIGEGNDITTISKFIESNYSGADCEGYFIAAAIANCKKDTVAAYDALIKYQDYSEYKSSLNYLARILLNEESISNKSEYKEMASAIRAKTEA